MDLDDLEQDRDRDDDLEHFEQDRVLHDLEREEREEEREERDRVECEEQVEQLEKEDFEEHEQVDLDLGSLSVSSESGATLVRGISFCVCMCRAERGGC